MKAFITDVENSKVKGDVLYVNAHRVIVMTLVPIFYYQLQVKMGHMFAVI